MPDVRGGHLVDGDARVRLVVGRGVTQLSQVAGFKACTGGAIVGLFCRPLTMVSCFWNGASGLRIGGQLEVHSRWPRASSVP